MKEWKMVDFKPGETIKCENEMISMSWVWDKEKIWYFLHYCFSFFHSFFVCDVVHYWNKLINELIN